MAKRPAAAEATSEGQVGAEAAEVASSCKGVAVADTEGLGEACCGGARVTAGVAVGGAVGGAVGAVYGTYEAIRFKVPGLLKIRYIGQTTLGSAAIFGLFLGAGSLIHCGKSY